MTPVAATSTAVTPAATGRGHRRARPYVAAAIAPTSQARARPANPPTNAHHATSRKPSTIAVSSGSTNISGPATASATSTPVPRRNAATANPSAGTSASSARQTPTPPVAAATGAN